VPSHPKDPSESLADSDEALVRADHAKHSDRGPKAQLSEPFAVAESDSRGAEALYDPLVDWLLDRHAGQAAHLDWSGPLDRLPSQEPPVYDPGQALPPKHDEFGGRLFRKRRWRHNCVLGCQQEQ